MAENRPVRVCEAQEDTCKRDVQALCYHCSRNLCRVHLVRHAQLMEDKIKAELNELTDKFNELSSRFNDLVFSDQILQEPLAQLERWSVEAHQKIDQMVMNKRTELSHEFEKHRRVFLQNNEEQLMKLNGSKVILRGLIEEADATADQIANLQRSIGETEAYLNKQTTPIFNLVAQSPNWFIDVRIVSPESQEVTPVDQIQEFQITYVRLSGLIRSYFIKTNKNGTIMDLIRSFIRQYTVMEEAIRTENNQNYTIDHLPKLDFILPIEIYNHRSHLQYKEDSSLKNIESRNMLVFYETPHSLQEQNNLRILMPCLFRNETTKQLFGLPIYLSVPRTGCRGTDIRDALHETLNKFYTPDPLSGLPAYNAFLRRTIRYQSTETRLDDALQDELDFSKVFIEVIAAFDGKFVDTAHWSYFNERRF